MISVQEAFRKIRENKIEMGITSVSIEAALGRVLQENLKADSDLPPFNRVMMDGIAIKYEDASHFGEFKIIGIQKAGEENRYEPKPGQAIEIMTGAILPESFDTIIPYENIELADHIAKIKIAPTKVGQHIHSKGKDFSENDVLVNFPCEIGVSEIGVAASIGKSELKVKALPKVLIIATGDELVDISAKPLSFQIRKSNDLVVKNVISSYCEKVDSIHIKDDLDELEKNLQARLHVFDVFIFIGGVSKGKFDFVSSLSNSCGFETIFHRIAQKPGKPMLFSRNKNKFIIGLPGNPVSAMICAFKYVLPWLKISGGWNNTELMIKTGEDIPAHHSLTLFIPVAIENNDGETMAYPISNNGSGDFASLVKADGWIEIFAQSDAMKKGSKVNFIPLKP